MALFTHATKLDPGPTARGAQGAKPSIMQQVLAARETMVIGQAG